MRFNLFSVCAASLLLFSIPRFAQSENKSDPYADFIAQVPPRTPQEEKKCFHLPPGFDIQLVAAEPYVRKPININFDDRNRIWVTESIEYPFPAAPSAPHRDTIRILQDVNGDGLADEVTTFTDGLNIPIGVLPVTGGAIAYSIPSVQRFYDTDGDDRAIKRKVLFGIFGHRDTHGMTGEFTLGFDGWIYACHGFSNTSVVKAIDGSTITMQSGNTYRFKPDGSHVEQFTHGQVNPFGLTFDPLGNLYSCDCHSRPIYMLLRGAYYPSFGKPDDGLGFGPEMLSHDHGSTAIAGITYYAANHFPPKYRDTIFIGNVVTNRINHDRIERHGSSYRAILQPDFLVCDDPWFRPVDIKLGPDGAIYVADFYNRIIGHYEVPLTHPGRDRERGRIWRIIYRGPDGKGYPRQVRANWARATSAELIGDLANPNLVVRMKAANQLKERGDTMALANLEQLLKRPSTAFQRMHALWVLEAKGKLNMGLVRAAAKDPAPGVRIHMMRILAERPDFSEDLRKLAVTGLKDLDPFVARAAADALGRHPAYQNISALLELHHRVPEDDSHLLHVVRMALRDNLLDPGRWAQLSYLAHQENADRAIADVATGVPSAEAATFLLHHLQRFSEPHTNQVRYVYHIARFGDESTAALLLDYARGDRAASLNHQVALFRKIAEGSEARGKPLSKQATDWGDHLIRFLLSSNDQDQILAGIDLVSSLTTVSVRPNLVALVGDKNLTVPLRAAAMTALLSMDSVRYLGPIAYVLNDASEPLSLREKAALLLGALNQPVAIQELQKTLPAAPEQLARAIAMGLAATSQGAEVLLVAVTNGKASPRLLLDRSIQINLERIKLPDLRQRLALLTKDLPPIDKRFDQLFKRRRIGFKGASKNLSLGEKVFEKNCANCHQLANKGAKIGPQLDGIGIRGLERLMEDILDPSRNVDQAFRLTTLGLKNGQIVSGLLLREEGQILVLADNQGKEIRIAKSAVEERTVSQLSPMPANLADQISETDFYNLLGFLLSQRPSQMLDQKNLSGKNVR